MLDISCWSCLFCLPFILGVAIMLVILILSIFSQPQGTENYAKQLANKLPLELMKLCCFGTPSRSDYTERIKKTRYSSFTNMLL